MSGGNGRALFAAMGCTACHGATGSGGIGPRIAGTGLSFNLVLSQLRSPRGSMPPFPPSTLSDAQARDIYTYLRSLP